MSRNRDQARALAIVRGNPSPEEVAALVAVLFARPQRGGVARVAETTRSEWSARYRLLRAPWQPGARGWRASGLPR